eukprot:2068922-Amphidinium_carterae.1
MVLCIGIRHSTLNRWGLFYHPSLAALTRSNAGLCGIALTPAVFLPSLFSLSIHAFHVARNMANMRSVMT